MKRSTYYYNVKRASRADKYAAVKLAIEAIYKKSHQTYGYLRITQELEKLGYHYNKKTIYKLMQKMGIQSIIRAKKQYKTGKVSHICDNILNRDFTSTKPNLKWVTDVTEIQINGNKVYLSTILDLYNREVISYTLSKSNNEKMVIDTLKQAIGDRKDLTGLIMHSDQGILYQAHDFRDMLKKHNIRQSMSRRGNCHDNAVAESFFATLKCELIYINKFKNIEQFKIMLEDYIYFYNNNRIKANGFTPKQEIEFINVA